MAAYESRRVRLRQWTSDDAETLRALFDDPLVYLFTPIPEPFDSKEAARRIEIGARGEATGHLLFRAILADDTPVGEVAGYRAETMGRVSASISYVVGAPFRGNGIARKAVALLASELRVRWKTNCLVANIGTDNEASQAVARALGFVPDDSAQPTPRRGKSYLTLPWVSDSAG